MKKFLLAILCTGFVSYGSAQECGTDQIPLLNRLLAHKKSIHELSGGNVIFVPVTFHLIADADGNNRVKEENLFFLLDRLNKDFNDQGMIFYIDHLNYINDDTLVIRQNSPYADALMMAERDTNSINVFIPNVINHGDNIYWAGFYYFYYDWLTLRRDNADTASTTLMHELGHYFSLPHTHAGWECTPYTIELYGNPVFLDSTIACSDGYGSMLIELQDGSNCDFSGDFICDTPPDYGIQNFVPSDCSGNTLIMDKNAEVITPDVNNFMGYYSACRQSFTAGQKAIMQTDYYSPEREYIRTGWVPDTASVDNQVVYIYPVNDEYTSGATDIYLDWEDTPGANQYMILLSRSASFTLNPLKYFTTESSFTIPGELVEGVRYYWKVWPYNESRTGAGYSPAQQFRVGESVAVVDLAQIDNRVVTPNPIRSGEVCQLTIGALHSFTANLRLVAYSGESVFNIMVDIPEGESTQNIETHHLSPGVYFLLLRSDTDFLVDKLIVVN